MVGASGASGLPGAGKGSGGRSPSGSGGASGNPATPANPDALLPARIRRLANAEYDTSVQVLLGDPSLSPTTEFDFPPDARQAGFTLNDAQRVDPIVAKQLATAAESIAARFKSRASELAPCSDANPGESCARRFIEDFGAKVYRRALTADEIDGPAADDGLLDLYRVGAEGAGYADGIELVVRGMLQSAGFLYLTELGEGNAASGSKIELTAYELAASLSYMATAGPPSEELLSSARAGELATAEGRRRAMADLLENGGTRARDRSVRLIREWIGIDRIGATAKDSNVYAAFDAVKQPLERESQEFIVEVLSRSTSTVGELLGADFTYSSGMLEEPLAKLYGVTARQGRIQMGTRRGILNQGAFLSVFAHAHESAPVLRGVAIGRRVACLSIASPSELNLVVTPPVPDPSKTTRQRFAIHATDGTCRGCHNVIDPIGFAFEQYDGMGQFRTQENQPGRNDGPPIDSTTAIELGADFDGSFANSDELAAKLAQSAQVRECFARHVFRGSLARSDGMAQLAEQEFIRYWHQLWASEDPAVRADPNEEADFVRIMLALAQSPALTQRIVMP
jgi:hypothetical protein